MSFATHSIMANGHIVWQSPMAIITIKTTHEGRKAISSYYWRKPKNIWQIWDSCFHWHHVVFGFFSSGCQEYHLSSVQNPQQFYYPDCLIGISTLGSDHQDIGLLQLSAIPSAKNIGLLNNYTMFYYLLSINLYTHIIINQNVTTHFLDFLKSKRHLWIHSEGGSSPKSLQLSLQRSDPSLGANPEMSRAPLTYQVA